MKREEKFRKDLIAHWRAEGYHVSHIESPITSAGIPDLHVRTSDSDYWIELKVERSDGIKLRPTQKAWHRNRANMGGDSWVVTLTSNDFTLITPGGLAHQLPADPDEWRKVSGACISARKIIPIINNMRDM